MDRQVGRKTVLSSERRLDRPIVVIDLVRMIAVLAVMSGHLGIVYLARPSESHFLNKLWYKLWVGGAYGVSMFFVISGYLITRLIAQSKTGLFKPDFRDFYSRRVGRIFPLLLLISIYGFAVVSFFSKPSPAFQHCFMAKDAHFGFGFWAAIATFWENWYQYFFPVSGLHWIVLWSLSVEEQFYFFYPMCLKWLGSRERLQLFLTFFILMGPVSRWGCFEAFSRSTAVQVQFNSFSGFGLIATGCLLCLIEDRTRNYLVSHPRICWHISILGFLIICRVYFKQPYFGDYWGRIFDHSILGLGLFLFLLGAVHLDISKWIFLKRLSLPGKLSYGMYLFQATTLFLLWDFLKTQTVFQAYISYVLVTWIAALLSYRFYEWPFNLFLRRNLGRPTKGFG